MRDPFSLFDQIIEERQPGDAPIQKAIIEPDDTEDSGEGSTLFP